jgi:acylpyruvate hydrolase
MRLLTFHAEGGDRLGALLGDQVLDLGLAYKAMTGEAGASWPQDMIALLREGKEALEKASAAIAYGKEHPGGICQPMSRVTLLPPVPRPGKVIALGINYVAHAAEGRFEPPDFPMLFHKTATALLGAGGTIVIPPVTKKVDYEGELAVIIGRTCKQVTEDRALEYVAGYAIANDVSARDIQQRTSQFTAGKMLDTFCPLGPALVTHDEIPEPGNLSIRTRLNGQVMQDGHTSKMIFSVPYVVSYISQIATLEVGDIVLTGTPEGVGFARTPPVWLQDGDVISVEIERLGILTNQVRTQDQPSSALVT